MDCAVLQPLVWTLSKVRAFKIFIFLLPIFRFAPIWKNLAENIKDWSPLVRVASINCADQSCDRYQVLIISWHHNSSFPLTFYNFQIEGTPTTRIFHPNTPANTMDSSYYGFDVPVKNDLEYYIKIILYNLGVSKNAKVKLDFDM